MFFLFTNLSSSASYKKVRLAQNRKSEKNIFFFVVIVVGILRFASLLKKTIRFFVRSVLFSGVTKKKEINEEKVDLVCWPIGYNL